MSKPGHLYVANGPWAGRYVPIESIKSGHWYAMDPCRDVPTVEVCYDVGLVYENFQRCRPFLKSDRHPYPEGNADQLWEAAGPEYEQDTILATIFNSPSESTPGRDRAKKRTKSQPAKKRRSGRSGAGKGRRK